MSIMEIGISQSLFSSYLAFILIFVLALVAVIPVIIGFATLGRIKHLATVIIAALNHCEYRTGKLDGCQISNLALLTGLVNEENFPKLTETFAEFERDSNKLFHGKWTTDLHKYINRERLLTQSQYRLLEADRAYKILTFGLFVTAFSLITTLAIGSDALRPVQPFTLLPALTATVFFFLIYYRSANARKDLDGAMKKFAETASLRLPIFSDLAGSAVLIDAFMQYDRKMDSSVAKLTNAVNALFTQDMVNAVSASIEKTMQQGVVPHIAASQQILGDLAQAVSTKQEAGLRDMAEKFTGQLTEMIARHMEVFFREVDGYLQQLNGTKGELAQALQLLDTHRQATDALDATFQQHLNSLTEYNQQTLVYLKQMAEAQANLGLSSRQLSELQAGSANSLVTLVGNLGQQVAGFAQSMSQLTSDIKAENSNTRQSIKSMINNQNKALEEYHKLSESMLDGSRDLANQAKIINQQLETMNSQLTTTVKEFNTAVVSGVNEVIATMDSDVSNITAHLTNTVEEIRDITDYARQNKSEDKEN